MCLRFVCYHYFRRFEFYFLLRHVANLSVWSKPVKIPIRPEGCCCGCCLHIYLMNSGFCISDREPVTDLRIWACVVIMLLFSPNTLTEVNWISRLPSLKQSDWSHHAGRIESSDQRLSPVSLRGSLWGVGDMSCPLCQHRLPTGLRSFPVIHYVN